jgi:uncharacterized protein (DUF2384 family)
MQCVMAGAALHLGLDDSSSVALIRLAAMIEEGLLLASLDRVAHAVAPQNHDIRHRIVPRADLVRRMRVECDRLSTGRERQVGAVGGYLGFRSGSMGE